MVGLGHPGGERRWYHHKVVVPRERGGDKHPPLAWGDHRFFPRTRLGRKEGHGCEMHICCHPKQPQDSEGGVTCDWKEVIFGLKLWPWTGQNQADFLHFVVPHTLRSWPFTPQTGVTVFLGQVKKMNTISMSGNQNLARGQVPQELPKQGPQPD